MADAFSPVRPWNRIRCDVMGHSSFAILSDRTVFRVSGADTHHCLDGLATVDAPRSGEAARFGALLSPQGKILFEFFMVADGDDVFLDTPAELSEAFLKRLSMYKLRANVGVTDVSNVLDVAVFWKGEAPEGPDMIVFSDPRAPGLGARALLTKAEDPGAAGFAKATEADYHAHRIALAVPEGGKDYPFGDTFPHDADYDQLGAVDFKKGCFVGQEVVSRMEHRGTARKRVVGISFDGAAPAADAAVVAGEKTIGTIGSTAGGRGLAMVRLDRAARAVADGGAITADGVTLTLVKPEWARFDWPPSSGSGEAA